jgi:hypothetical protein
MSSRRDRRLAICQLRHNPLLISQWPFPHTEKWIQKPIGLYHSGWKSNMFHSSTTTNPRIVLLTYNGVRHWQTSNQAKDLYEMMRQTVNASVDRLTSCNMSTTQTVHHWKRRRGFMPWGTRKRRLASVQYRCTLMPSPLFRHCHSQSSAAILFSPQLLPLHFEVSTDRKSVV